MCRGVCFYPCLYICLYILCPCLYVWGCLFLPMSVHLSVYMSCIWFLLNNLSSPLSNHLKLIHKVRDHYRFRTSLLFFHFLGYAPVYFSWTLSILFRHILPFFSKWSCITEICWFFYFWRFNATFNYIMATSFSGGRNRREPPTMGKQLVSFITCGCESSAPFFVIYKGGWEPTPYWW